MNSDEESDPQHQEFILSFYNLIQDINECTPLQQMQDFVTKTDHNRTAKFIKNAKVRTKANQINFKMPSSTEENVFDIVSFNKNQAEKLVKPMRNQTKNLENSQVEPYIVNVHQMLRHLKLKQQILRNVQKYVYLNLIDYYKLTEKRSNPKTNFLHISASHLAEKIYANQMKEFVNCKPQPENPNIIIPSLSKPTQSRKESTG